MYISFAVWNLQCNLKMLSETFKDVVLKKPVQSSMIFVRLGQGLFKFDYITRYLHTWVVLRLCIIFTIGESPRFCAKYCHLYYHLLIWGGAKVSRAQSNYSSSIALSNYFYRTENANCADYLGSIAVDQSRSNCFAHNGQRALIYTSVLIMRIMYILWYAYQYVNRDIAKPTQ